ncbi:DUF3298 domain-containing protein [Nocardia sp. NPDC058058]|uniref:DUF3298 domain-containing protein n=1 Tax=Nocardia sp. NPDC058058 TaxID=3346317 RepID=UPI0036DCED0C
MRVGIVPAACLAVVGMLALAGCGSARDRPESPGGSAAVSVTGTPLAASRTSTPPAPGNSAPVGTTERKADPDGDLRPFTAAATISGTSNERAFSGALRQSVGAGPGGAHTWDVRYYELDGSDAVTTAFNRASRSSAQTNLRSSGLVETGDGSCVARVEPRRIEFRPTAIGEVLAGNWYCAPAAHYNNTVSTIVIDSRTAEPITLADLFTDVQAGLRRLSDQVVERVGVPATLPGVRPVEANFGNWIPAESGMVLFFPDYQLGGFGMRSVTIPWSALADLIAPGQRGLIPG